MKEEELASQNMAEEFGVVQQPMGELLGLIKDFMAGQQKREQGLLEEMRNFRVFLQPSTPRASDFPEGFSSAGSSRIALPTPAPGRRPPVESTALHRAQDGSTGDFGLAICSRAKNPALPDGGRY